jgi:glutamate-1-semialdehyde 2,1-aminomutase
MIKLKKSNSYLRKAEKLIPALSQTFSKAPYSYVQGTYPVYLKNGKGSHVFDVDDNEFIDYVLGLGPITLGYSYPAVDNAIKKQLKDGISFSMPHYLEVDLSEKLSKIIPGADMVRFTKTGSDAGTAAIRAARAITKKDKILYWGSGGVWHDWFTTITSRNAGIPKFNRNLISKFEYNNLEFLKEKFDNWKDQIAAIYMEPMIFEHPKNNFLKDVKKLAHKNNTVLIFDEVVTGFRYANGGVSEYLGIEPDIAVWGKGIANGMPLGVITGKTEYMRIFESIFYSTSYAGETLSLAAGLAVINEIETKPVIEHSWQIGKKLHEGFNKISANLKLNFKMEGLPIRGSIVCYDENGKPSNLLKSILYQELIQRGVMFGPGGIFVSYSHSDKDIKSTLLSCENAMKFIKKEMERKPISKILKGEEMKKVMTF